MLVKSCEVVRIFWCVEYMFKLTFWSYVVHAVRFSASLRFTGGHLAVRVPHVVKTSHKPFTVLSVVAADWWTEPLALKKYLLQTITEKKRVGCIPSYIYSCQNKERWLKNVNIILTNIFLDSGCVLMYSSFAAVNFLSSALSFLIQVNSICAFK